MIATTTTTDVPVLEGAGRPRRVKRKKAAAKASKVEPLVYRKAEVCRALGNINKSTLERMVDRGEFPRADVRMGRAIGWRVSTVLAWLDDPSAFATAKKGGRA